MVSSDSRPKGCTTIQISDTRDRLDATDVDLSGSHFQNVNLSQTTFQNVDLSTVTITDAAFRAARIENADLRDVALSDCRLAGATIDGIPVEAMIAEYRRANPPET